MRAVISILMFLYAGYHLAFQELNGCHTTHKVLQCENIFTFKGFTYQVPENMSVYLRDRHCEHGWSHANGTFIAESAIDGELGSAVAVTPESLTLSICANLQWEIRCDHIPFHCVFNYTVKHRATPEFRPGNDTFSEDKDANSPNWLTAGIVGSVIVLFTIISVTSMWFLKRKSLNRPEDNRSHERGSETVL